MAGAAERFLQAAAGRGLEPEIRRFPAGTRTAADAARAVGCEIAQIVKSLVFMAGAEAFVALTSGPNRADTARLAAAIGAAEVRKATPEEARAATGFAIGGTPPFGYPKPLRTFVDPDLLAHETVWAAGGTPDGVFPVPPRELLRITGGDVLDFTVVERPRPTS